MGISVARSNISKSPTFIEVYRGASKEIELEIKEPGEDIDGNPIENPFDLTGCTLYFSVRNTPGHYKELIKKTSESATQIQILSPANSGKAKIFLDYSDTKLMEPGKYCFDVWVKKADGKRFPVVKPSDFVILPAVTTI